MELRHIRYFLAVAEEGHFTRAAARLGIGQPPLSMQIRDLEAEVGVQLFYRRPHGAELTEAGRAFRDMVQAIPGQVADAARAAQRAAKGETGVLNLGFSGTAALNPIVPAAIRSFRREYPDVEIRLQEENSPALFAALLAGDLDVAVMRPSASDPEQLKTVELATEPLVVALPAAHPCAHSRGGLALADIASDPVILAPRSMGVSLYDAALRAYQAAGLEPRMGQPAPHIVSILSLVAAEAGVSILPASMRQLDMAGVAFRPIRAPAPRIGLSAVCPASNPARPALNFIALAQAAARELKAGA